MKVRTLTAIIALLIFLPILLMGGTTLIVCVLTSFNCIKRTFKYEYD